MWGIFLFDDWVARPKRSEGRGLFRARKTHFPAKKRGAESPEDFCFGLSPRHSQAEPLGITGVYLRSNKKTKRMIMPMERQNPKRN